MTTHRALTSLLTIGVALAALPGDAGAICGRTARAVRFLTWNVACTTGWQSFEDTFGEDDEDRMVDIAAKIKEINADVVVLTEVLDDGNCKDVLLDELKGFYSHYIEEIDDNNFINEDSGLMFFSRLPLIEFPQDVYYGGEGDFEVQGNAAGTTWDEFNGSDQRRTIAVHGFDDDECVLGDCMAEKAAAMVRVSGGSGCPINVAFTHMTAVYGDDDYAERNERIAAQAHSLQSIKRMITDSLTPTQLRTEPVFLLGDVNIDGNFGPDGENKNVLDADHHPLVWPQESPHNVWEHVFDPFWSDSTLLESGFYACGAAGFDGTGCVFNGTTATHFFTDLAAFEHPRTDLFQTNGTSPQNPDYYDGFDPDIIIDFTHAEGGGLRLDYILRNHPRDTTGTFSNQEFVCAQHLRRERFFNQRALSDHAPVILDAGQNAPRCTPLPDGEFGSMPLIWDTGDPQDKAVPGSIAYRNNMQWYVIDQKGTYSFAAPSGFLVRVYGKHDLSTEKDDFMNQTNSWTDTETESRVSGPIYVFDDPPYYIKVLAPPSTTTFPLAYTLFVHKHGCTNPTNDYCLLKAGALTEMPWPESDLLSYPDPSVGTDAYYQDQAYFAFAVVDSSDGTLPEIDFLVQGTGTAPLLDPPSTADGTGVRIFRGDSYDFSLCDCNSEDDNAECDTDTNVCNEPIAFDNWDPAWVDTAEPLGESEKIGHTRNQTHLDLFPDVPGTAQKHFLRVARSEVEAFTMHLTYLNTLTTFRATNVYCEIQNDTTGDDEIYAHSAIDLTGHPGCNSLGSYASLGDFDSESGGSDKGAAIGKRRFASIYGLAMCEEDSGFNGANDSFSTLGGSNVTTPELDVSTVISGGFTFADTLSFDDRDYSYQVDYELSHEDESLNLQ